MKFRILAAAAAAVTMAATPAIAADRVSAPVDGESEIGGGVSIIVALLAAAAVIGGLYIAIDGGDDDDFAVSP